MSNFASDYTELATPPEGSNYQAWRSVAHRLSASIGLIRSVEPQFNRLSDDAKEILEDGINRLLRLVDTCVENQEHARQRRGE